MLKEYDDAKEHIKNLKTKQSVKCFNLFIKQCYLIIWSVKNSKVVSTKNGWIVVISNCVVCSSKKLRFIKKQEACGLLSYLRKSTFISWTPSVNPLLFYCAVSSNKYHGLSKNKKLEDY